MQHRKYYVQSLARAVGIDATVTLHQHRRGETLQRTPADILAAAAAAAAVCVCVQVNIGLRVLTRPNPEKLPEIYRSLGQVCLWFNGILVFCMATLVSLGLCNGKAEQLQC
jgi:hypothetical protein